MTKERYNYIESDKAIMKRCVHPWGEHKKFGDFTYCDGEGCMGWVQELSSLGKPTGRGRCGMVFPIYSSCTCETVQDYDGSMSIVDWKKKTLRRSK